MLNLSMKKFLLACLISTAVLSACKKETPVAPRPADALASVNGVYLTQKELDEAFVNDDARTIKYLKTTFGKQALLDALLREKIMTEDARETGVDRSKPYLNALNEMQEDFAKRFEEAKRTELLKVWLESLREKGVTAVSQEEIDAYYKKYPYEITIRHMVIANADDANAVLRELKASSTKEKRFIELAARFSIDPEEDGLKGRPFTFIPGEFLPEIENAAANSSAGQVQGFFKTARGFHIIYKVKEGWISKANAQDRISRIIMNGKLDDYLKSLTEKYNVEVYKTYED